MTMQVLRRMAEAAKAVHEYKGSELSKHLDEMLSSLIDSYRADLESISQDGLTTLQAHLRQAIAIRGVIRGEQELPRV